MSELKAIVLEKLVSVKDVAAQQVPGEVTQSVTGMSSREQYQASLKKLFDQYVALLASNASNESADADAALEGVAAATASPVMADLDSNLAAGEESAGETKGEVEAQVERAVREARQAVQTPTIDFVTFCKVAKTMGLDLTETRLMAIFTQSDDGDHQLEFGEFLDGTYQYVGCLLSFSERLSTAQYVALLTTHTNAHFSLSPDVHRQPVQCPVVGSV